MVKDAGSRITLENNRNFFFYKLHDDVNAF